MEWLSAITLYKTFLRFHKSQNSHEFLIGQSFSQRSAFGLNLNRPKSEALTSISLCLQQKCIERNRRSTRITKDNFNQSQKKKEIKSWLIPRHQTGPSHKKHCLPQNHHISWKMTCCLGSEMTGAAFHKYFWFYNLVILNCVSLWDLYTLYTLKRVCSTSMWHVLRPTQ